MLANVAFFDFRYGLQRHALGVLILNFLFASHFQKKFLCLAKAGSDFERCQHLLPGIPVVPRRPVGLGEAIMRPRLVHRLQRQDRPEFLHGGVRIRRFQIPFSQPVVNLYVRQAIYRALLPEFGSPRQCGPVPSKARPAPLILPCSGLGSVSNPAVRQRPFSFCPQFRVNLRQKLVGISWVDKKRKQFFGRFRMEGGFFELGPIFQSCRQSKPGEEIVRISFHFFEKLIH